MRVDVAVLLPALLLACAGAAFGIDSVDGAEDVLVFPDAAVAQALAGRAFQLPLPGSGELAIEFAVRAETRDVQPVPGTTMHLYHGAIKSPQPLDPRLNWARLAVAVPASASESATASGTLTLGGASYPISSLMSKRGDMSIVVESVAAALASSSSSSSSSSLAAPVVRQAALTKEAAGFPRTKFIHVQVLASPVYRNETHAGPNWAADVVAAMNSASVVFESTFGFGLIVEQAQQPEYASDLIRILSEPTGPVLELDALESALWYHNTNPSSCAPRYLGGAAAVAQERQTPCAMTVLLLANTVDMGTHIAHGTSLFLPEYQTSMCGHGGVAVVSDTDPATDVMLPRLLARYMARSIGASNDTDSGCSTYDGQFLMSSQVTPTTPMVFSKCTQDDVTRINNPFDPDAVSCLSDPDKINGVSLLATIWGGFFGAAFLVAVGYNSYKTYQHKLDILSSQEEAVFEVSRGGITYRKTEDYDADEVARYRATISSFAGEYGGDTGRYSSTVEASNRRSLVFNVEPVKARQRVRGRRGRGARAGRGGRGGRGGARGRGKSAEKAVDVGGISTTAIAGGTGASVMATDGRNQSPERQRGGRGSASQAAARKASRGRGGARPGSRKQSARGGGRGARTKSPGRRAADEPVPESGGDESDMYGKSPEQGEDDAQPPAAAPADLADAGYGVSGTDAAVDEEPVLGEDPAAAAAALAADGGSRGRRPSRTRGAGARPGSGRRPSRGRGRGRGRGAGGRGGGRKGSEPGTQDVDDYLPEM